MTDVANIIPEQIFDFLLAVVLGICLEVRRLDYCVSLFEELLYFSKVVAALHMAMPEVYNSR